MGEDRSVLTRPAAEPDAVARYGPEPEHVVDLRFAPDGGQRPLVVVVHGGFWRPEYDRHHVRPLTEALAAAGWSSAAVEYRREPGRPDRTVDDVVAAVRWVAQQDPEALHSDGRILLVGHSAGGHLALLAATGAAVPPAVRGVVALAPVADLALADRLDLDGGAVRDFLGAAAAERPDLDPARAGAPPVPVLLVHGEEDAIVPIALSTAYAAAHPAVSPGAEPAVSPGAEPAVSPGGEPDVTTDAGPVVSVVRAPGGHFAVIDPSSAAWPLVEDALARLSS